MVRFRPALIMGRLIPSRLRERLFEASYQELLADYLRGRSERIAVSRLARRLVFEARAFAMAGDCWRLYIAERLFKQGPPLRITGNVPARDGGRRRGALMDSFFRDIKYAVRQLARSPVFTATAVIIVAVGIGANTAAFSVVNAMLFRALPFESPAELVDIYQDSDEGGPSSTSFPAYRDIAGYTDIFKGVTASYTFFAGLQRDEGSTLVLLEFAPSNHFPVLGLRPAIGRWFETGDDAIGGEPLAVLTHRAWQSKFGGDPNILGEVLRVNGAPVTVVGVGPEGYNGIAPVAAIDFWLSLSALASVQGDYAAGTLERREDHWFMVKARLREEVTATQAQQAMNGLAARLGEEFPEINEGRDITVFQAGEVRIHPSIDGFLTPTAAFLMAVVGLVLLIACSNLANLLLVRASARGRELSIRLAVGASRAQVVRQLVTESVLLALLGGATGWLLANWALRSLMALQTPLPIPVSVEVGLDGRVLVFTLVVSFLTGLIFGLVPALRASRPDLASAMRDDAQLLPWRSRRFALRNLLVVAQVAMSFVLLVAAGMFIRSIGAAESIEAGFAIDGVAFLQTDATQAGYTPEDAQNLYQIFAQRIRELPGVDAVSLGAVLPVNTVGGSSTLVIDGYEPSSGTGSVEAPFSIVDETYFETLQIPLLHGRVFSDADQTGSERVAVINEEMARRYWGDSDAVGRRFRSQGSADSWVHIIGVVGDTKVRELTEEPRVLFYRAWEQVNPSRVTFFVRTAGDPGALVGTMRRELRAVNDALPVQQAKTMEAHLSDSLFTERLAAQFVGAFGFLALALASLGLYGVVSFTVSRRMLEVGVRMALGADSRNVVWLVLRDVVGLVAVGIVVGLGLALGAAIGLAGLLYGVSPVDPVTYIGVSAILLLIAVIAGFAPALRAASADPVTALRQS